MLKLLFKGAIKSPFKLLAICVVVYLASISLFIGGLLILLAVGWAKQEIDKRRRAAEAVKTAERPAAAEASQPLQRAANVPAANDAIKSAPKRQYAKSAVVIPLKTGSM